MKQIISLFLILSAYTSVFACLNETKVLLNGKYHVNDMEYVPYGHHFYKDKAEIEKELMEMDALWKSKRDLDAYSDYGVLLAYLGRYDEAKAVYEEIEKITPGRYSTAANLGTVYELLGQNDLALKWIKKAVEIDPTSHEGSEWIHVKILEAKIKGDKALTSEFLLGINFGNDTIPESQMDSTELVKLREALFFNFKNEFHS